MSSEDDFSKLQYTKYIRCFEMNERKIINELSRILKVDEENLPKTIQRFKKEIEELQKGVRN